MNTEMNEVSHTNENTDEMDKMDEMVEQLIAIQNHIQEAQQSHEEVMALLESIFEMNNVKDVVKDRVSKPLPITPITPILPIKHSNK